MWLLPRFIDKKESIVITAWFDNKQVFTISNYIGKEPLDDCKCSDKISKKKRDIERSHSLAVCNKFKGGVDKSVMYTKVESGQKCPCAVQSLSQENGTIE